MKILLTDLDGTLRKTKSGNTFINDPTDQELTSYAREIVDGFTSIGWKIIAITNQGGVKAGYKSLEDCIKEQKITLELLFRTDEINAYSQKIERLLFCPNQGESAYSLQGFQDSEIPTEKYLSHLEKWFHVTSNFYRKPAPGMLLLAIMPFVENGRIIEEIIYTGDRQEDVEAVVNANYSLKNNKGLYDDGRVIPEIKFYSPRTLVNKLAGRTNHGMEFV